MEPTSSFFQFDSLMVLSGAFFCVIVFLVIYAFKKMQTISILRKNIHTLENTIEELDQQATFILRGDMELKLYQEEVDDKLNKLSLLKNLIFSSIHILDQEKIFLLINEQIIHSLGFSQGLVVRFDDSQPVVNFGFNEEDIKTIVTVINPIKEILKTSPLVSSDNEPLKKLKSTLKTKAMLATAIKARDKMFAIFFLANPLDPDMIRQEDKEMFLIICMYLGQCLDNTELFEDIYHAKDELEKKIRERTNELVKSMRDIETISKLKSDFISQVSHELRTPLTSVKGFSALLVEEKFGKLPAEAQKRLQKIDDNVDKLVNMVNTLLDIARIESGKIEVSIAPTDLSKLVNEVTELLYPQIQNKNIVLKCSVPENISVLVDKHLIERVFVNLITNAIKFTPEKGTIAIQCNSETSHLTICVSDTGCGIAAKDQEKLFQEFYRVDNPINRQTKGTGLGLSLVKHIIDLHKEKIWIESEEGQGTRVYFTLKTAV